MSKDLEIIRRIEKKLGCKLGRLNSGDTSRTSNGYTVDSDENVIVLNLYSMKLTDISFIRNLSHLIALDLRSNQLTNISALQNLKNLTRLYLSSNQITNITPLKNLKNLTVLDLRSNEISNVNPLQSLLNLTFLYLSSNRLTDISFLKDLSNLKQLYLMDNQISRLSADIVEWGLAIKWEYNAYEEGVFLEGNPLELPPVEIVKQGTEGIQVYFRSLENGRFEKRALNEVKVLLVGDGGAGKTSLMKQLLGEKFDKNESQTHGINICAWQRKLGERNIKVNFWDFGGQEIMHATHQFFFSRRSLYVLVLDGRKDEDPEYWLKNIESFGGDSPILIVINKIDENPGFDVNRKFLQVKYKTIGGYNRVSCRTSEGIGEFRRKLEQELVDMEHLQTLWPENWFRVKKRLEAMKADFISYEKYEEICRNEGINEDDACQTLVEFLHDLGVVLHFSDPALKETNVINPRWATEGVYDIVNSRELADHQGVLPMASLESILEHRKYPPRRHDFLVELMKKFELCYSLENDSILIPDLLPVGEPEFAFDYDTALKFQIHFEFFPRSIMPRFMVKMRRDIQGKLRWRTGVVLADSAFGSSAVVRADGGDKKIYIYVQGEQKRNYFSVIWKIFRDINDDFKKLKYSQWVPLPDRDDILVEFEELIGLERLGIDLYTIGKLGKRYPVKLLLDGIEDEYYRKLHPDSPPDHQDFLWDVFISYSSKDFAIVQGIIDDFKSKGIRYWWDEEQIMPGDLMSQKIAEGLQKSRAVMPCFSRHQIESGWCRVEYTAVLNKVISGQTGQRVTPLVLDDLPLEEYPILLGDYKYERLSDSRGYAKLLRALKR